jgi:hypothetical protein
VKSLLLEKHAEYIAAYGNKKDDYVRWYMMFDRNKVALFSHDFPNSDIQI